MTTSETMAQREQGCVFCDIVVGREPREKVTEDERTVAFMDIDPRADGHVLVIPKAHSSDLLTISAEDLVATMLMAQRIARVAYPALGAEGITMLNCCGEAGWQPVSHFHLRLNPRYADRRRDRMELPYEPAAPSDPKVRAAYADALAKELRAGYIDPHTESAGWLEKWMVDTRSARGGFSAPARSAPRSLSTP